LSVGTVAHLVGLSFLSLFCSAAVHAEEARASELLEMPLDRLLTLEVVSASTYAQPLQLAPSSSVIVTSQDIRTYGYRTLADVLAGMPGLYISNDRSWEYIGVRGFSRPGDYNSRVLLLVDGMRTNDNIYNQAYIGNDFLVDLDLVERVEFSPGPGASIYGDNAFLGVINVVTKKARDMKGVATTAELSRYRGYKGSVRYGGEFDNGAELVMSATASDTAGRDWHYPEFPGKARDMDGEDFSKVFAKFSFEGLTLEAGRMRRDKNNPTAPFGTNFNDPRYETRDTHTFASATYEHALSETSSMRLHFNHGRFDYEGYYPTTVLNIDRTHGTRNIMEGRLTSTAFDGHKIVTGIEYIRDAKLDMVNFDLAPAQVLLRERRDADKFGIYLQDEIRLHDKWLLNAGLRYDHYDSFGGTVNPRLALIHQPTPADTFKLIYGRAFRAPNAYEQFYGSTTMGSLQKGNPDLRPEIMQSYEATWDTALNSLWHAKAGLFHYRIKDTIGQELDPVDNLWVFRNLGRVRTNGAELGLEGLWLNGVRMRSSVTYQDAREAETDEWLVNSPRLLAKVELSARIYGEWQAGAELQHIGRRRTLADETGSATLANLTLNRRDYLPGLDVSIGFNNLFDKRYAVPADLINVQDSLRQDGRMFRIKLDYRF
jgi:outer membrane receptor protein involved in Fe transport